MPGSMRLFLSAEDLESCGRILGAIGLSMTIRSLLLRELDKRGVKVTPEVPSRVEVDGAVLRVLGFGEDEVGRIPDYLYPALANEIEQLKTLMKG